MVFEKAGSEDLVTEVRTRNTLKPERHCSLKNEPNLISLMGSCSALS